MGSVEKHGKGILNEGAFSHTETFALAIAMLCVGRCNALRWRLQCFALAVAKLCVGGCNALRWRFQCFVLAVAMLCVGDCNALRLRLAKLAQKSSVIFWIREKGGNSPYTGHCSPQEIYAAPKCVLFPC